MPWSAAILAGGSGRRLGGRDKSTLALDGGRFIDRQVALLGSLTSYVMVVGGPAERCAGLPATAVADLVPGAGALGGLYTALVASPTERVLVVACDLPFLTEPFLAFLMRSSDGYDVTAPRTSSGLQPLCACYTRSAAPALRRSIDRGILKVRDALDGLRLHIVDEQRLAAFDPDGRLLLNVNTPADYQRALAPLP
jgi:molybdenum cofactor guanylyltransferase